MRAPLVLFVYNRASHTANLLKAIDNTILANETNLYIFSDCYKNEEDKDSVIEVRRIISEYSKESKFKSVHIFYQDSNKGLAESIIEGVTDLITEFGVVIVLEDDLIVSKDFLQFMNGALTFYKNVKDIWAISGYTFPMKALDDYSADIYYSGRGCSWGWATWKEKWEKVDWNVNDYNRFRFDFFARKRFAKWGPDLPYMLDDWVLGRNHSWAIRWCYAASKNNQWIVYPKVSRVYNSGTDGTGTNFNSSTDKFKTELFDGDYSCVFCDCKPNERIRREFRSKYMSRKARIKAFIKKILRDLKLYSN